MTVQLTDLDDRGLEVALIQLGRDLGGAHRDVSVGVVTALRSGSAPEVGRAPARRLIIALSILTLLLAGAATAIRFGVPGVAIREGATQPPLPRTPLSADPAFLGRFTSLDEARQQVDFDVRAPSAEWIGQPDVYYSQHPQDGRVSLVYAASEDLPAIGDTAVGMLVTQFRGNVASDFLTKLRNVGAPVTRVRIGQTEGWWIEETHEVLHLDASQRPTSERLRFADSTLLWTRDGVTLRLESRLDLERAVDVAASVR